MAKTKQELKKYRRSPLGEVSDSVRNAAGRAVSKITEPLSGQSVGPNAPMGLPRGAVPRLKPKGKTQAGAPYRNTPSGRDYSVEANNEAQADSAKFSRMREHGANRVFRRK